MGVGAGQGAGAHVQPGIACMTAGDKALMAVCALLVAVVYCSGAPKRCGPEDAACARCQYVLGLGEYFKSKGSEIIDALQNAG